LKMNRLLKKGISLVVVIAVMLSIVSPALAEAITLSGSSIGYLALGDDISNGVGLNNPDTESYAVKIAQALYGAQWETSYKLRAGAGYRVEELRYLIDNDYNGDGYTEQFFGTPDTPFERDKRQGAVRADVSNADYITISAGVNNFSTYIVEQLLYYIENNGATRYSYDIGAVLDEVDLGPLSDYNVYDTIDTIKTIVIKELSAAVDQDVEKAIDLVDFAAEVSTYAVLSYIISFNEVIKEIHAINPDAEVYVIGLYNPAQDELLTLEVDGKVSDLEIGKCFETLIEMANAYTQILAPRKFDYTYVHPGNPQLLIDVMADKNLTIEDRIPSALKTKLLNASEDTAVTLIQDMFKSYGIEKSYDEALDIAYEIFDAPTADDRLDVIYAQINDLAVDEVLKQFKKQLESFTGTYSDIQLTDQEVLDLLNDLREATATAEKTVEKVREEIATLFVVDLMYEAMVGQTFAGVHIDSKEEAKQVIEDLENA